jgi:AcrR family transcriptional regulator
MIVQKLNKHELKTKETRELLLHAAEKIFVRDGYEGAELGEIASLAGRTKGAIYAQFKSKEDIFLALIEKRGLNYRAQMLERLAKSKSVEQNLEALRQFYLELSEDRAWALLMLEFKLFAIRHPEAKKRLQTYYAQVMPPHDQEKRISAILGPAGKGKEALSRSVAVQTLQPLLSALVLEAQVDPDLLKDEVLRTIFGRLFDTLFVNPTA